MITPATGPITAPAIQPLLGDGLPTGAGGTVGPGKILLALGAEGRVDEVLVAEVVVARISRYIVQAYQSRKQPM